MTKTKIILIAIFLFLTGGLFISQFSSNSTSPRFITNHMKTIHFATDATYPPFEYMDESGKMKGYDIDVANALCTQMKAQCVFTNTAFDKLIPQLNAKKFDAIIGSISISEMRRGELKYTNVTYNPSLAYLAPLDKHFIAGDVLGKTIGVVKDSSFENYLNNKYRKNVTVKSYDTLSDAITDLQAGKVDMVLGNPIAIKTWVSQGDNGKQYGIVIGPVINNQYFGSGFGIGVRPNDQRDLNALNKALIEIKVNGVYDKITRKYFGG